MKVQRGVFDVAVIGGGVVGCAVVRRFALDGARVVLLEKAADILAGASKANSALLHTGFDAPPESLELACMQAGYREYLDIRERMNLPLLETGAMVVAWSDEDLAKLGAIEQQARTNGVDDVRLLGATEIRSREPHLAAGARGALLVPGEHVVDPWSAPLAYLTQAVHHGAEAWFNAEVLAGQYHGGIWTLETSRGEVRARSIINCAGLFGDVIEQRLLGSSDFTILPRKGQFVVFDKAAASLLRTIILPVPNERTKGVVLARTIFGNVLVGPTAEEQRDRNRADVEQKTLRLLVTKAVEMVPALADVPVTAIYAGLRPATERKEYRVSADTDRRWISIGGIRSTGLTAALGLAQHAAELHRGFGDTGFTTVAEPVWPRMPNLAEHLERDWQADGHGEIVCHCELVTRREIEAALSGPLPASDIGGLKRRTRAGMGRCQGFYCQAHIAALTVGKLAEPLTVEASHE
ncbi:NAD(P)/FAD-dependent oxidoreductase [Mesorhizobium sp. INR15]|uniref:NAD(P)/FAD-dependent oxidoreductase n=1 Tax=Mesorhizobium sp. INR15 TaxID=2654248 RepID=UPI0018968638|nr:NAD(P)/FAD-dependent oxidoreductase [Mesorhizobium sp. INR15]QPC94517.1 FAD-dependent oxidoreductase [Mesorhizobium sp. INR15]